MSKLPEGWQVTQLDNIAVVRVSNVDKKLSDKEQPVRLCNYMDVYNQFRITDNLPFMQGTASVDEIRQFSLKPQDVIITKDSETREDIARSAFVTEKLNNVICGYHLAILRPIADRVLGEYLCYVLQSAEVHQQFIKSANGLTRFGLTILGIQNVTILLPPLPEQRAIAAILSTWDEAITLTERLIAALRQRKRALMDVLLIHTRELPDEWRWARLGEFLKQRKQWITIDDDEIYRRCTVKLHNLGVFPRDIVNGRQVKTKRQQLTHESDLLVAEIDAKVGGFGIVRGDTSGSIVSSHYFLFNIADELEVDFLDQCIRAGILQKQVDAIGSTNYAAIRPEQIFGYKIPLPTIDSQREIADFLVNCDIEIELYSHLLLAIREQKRGLMQQLLTGAIRVQVGE